MAGLAREYLGAIEHVVGPQPGIRAIAIEGDHDRDAKQIRNLCRRRRSGQRRRRGDCDGYFWRLAVKPVAEGLCAHDRRILYGANLPMLLKLAKSRDKDLPDAVRAALDAGRKYIDSHNVSAE